MPILSYSGDQFGYYTVGTAFKTYSKLQAIEEMQRTGTPLVWHFNDKIYDAYPWTQEPTESLDELYRRRAQEIRDAYDYVVLFYSGGADSWCMLNAFLKNDIKIDEIVQIHSYAADRDKHSVFNEEIFFTAIPHTEKIIEKYPNIRHRVIDLSTIIDDLYLRPDVKYEYIYNIKGIMSANSLARSYIRDYTDDYKRIMDSGKKMCFLWGAEKPRIRRINGKYHTLFVDVFSETNLRLQSLDTQGYFDEWFFWSPTSAPIIAKQCHILLKVMRAGDKLIASWLAPGEHNYLPLHPSGQRLRNDIYHQLIYPGWDPTTLVAPKPQNLMLSERDNWFWAQNPETNIAVRNAQEGIKEIVKRIGDSWLNDTTDITRGIKGCFRFYPIE
jgi:hypothetical protein